MSSASIYKQNELPQNHSISLKHEAFKYNLQEKELHHYLLEIKLQFIFWKTLSKTYTRHQCIFNIKHMSRSY